MLCRWLAVLILAGILLVIEAIAISQGTFTRDQRVLSGSLVHGSRNVSGVPAFETNVPRNVTTAVGQTAFLHCRVHQLGDKEVSRSREKIKKKKTNYSHEMQSLDFNVAATSDFAFETREKEFPSFALSKSPEIIDDQVHVTDPLPRRCSRREQTTSFKMIDAVEQHMK